jgi:hypothetical protein
MSVSSTGCHICRRHTAMASVGTSCLARKRCSQLFPSGSRTSPLIPRTLSQNPSIFASAYLAAASSSAARPRQPSHPRQHPAAPRPTLPHSAATASLNGKSPPRVRLDDPAPLHIEATASAAAVCDGQPPRGPPAPRRGRPHPVAL